MHKNFHNVKLYVISLSMSCNLEEITIKVYVNFILRSIKKLVHVKSVQRSDIKLYYIKQGLKLHNNFCCPLHNHFMLSYKGPEYCDIFFD